MMIKKRYFVHLSKYIIYYIFILILSVLVGYLVIYAPYIQVIDNFFYVKINSLPHPDFIENLIFPFNLWFFPFQSVFFYPAFFYFLFASFFIYLGVWRRSMVKWGILTLFLGLILAGMLLKVDWIFIFRHRPFEFLPSTVDNVTREILMRFPSYPSGHVRDAAVVSTIMGHFVPKSKWVFIVFVFFIAFSRVYEGAHYPTDVVGGALFGYLIGKLSIHFFQVHKKISP